MPGDDDFLKFFTDTLASVVGLDAQPHSSATPVARTPSGQKLLYVGFDDATRTVFQQNLGDHMPFVDTADLGLVKNLITQGEAGLIVFDSTSFIRPGIAITKFIKERNLPIRVAHVYGAQRVTEEYEKYRLYHLHIQPDYRALSEEIFALIDKIKADFGF